MNRHTLSMIVLGALIVSGLPGAPAPVAAQAPAPPPISNTASPTDGMGMLYARGGEVIALQSAPIYATDDISIYPYPVSPGEPTQICVNLHNPTSSDLDATVQFSWAYFGIGLPFTPIAGPQAVHVPANEMRTVCLMWVPPFAGQFCVQVDLQVAGHAPVFAQRNVDVDEPLAPGQDHALLFPVGNPSSGVVTVTLGMVPHLSGWSLSLSQDVLPNMAPGETRAVTLTVAPPPGVLLPEPDTPIVDVEGYVGAELIGGFRKLFRPPILLHRFPDPGYAEREITAVPYPTQAGHTTELCVELSNPTSADRAVEVQFAWAAFGIGLPFTPIGGPLPAYLPAGSAVNKCTLWTPPVSGNVCLQVELTQPDCAPQFSRRNIDANEPLRPGLSHAQAFLVGNPTSSLVTVTLSIALYLDGWNPVLSKEVLTFMAPGETRVVSLTVTPPLGVPLPELDTPIVDVQGYADGELISGIRKVYRPSTFSFLPFILKHY